MTDLSSITTVPIDQVLTTGRMRSDFGDIGALAVSIRENGLIQPIRLAIKIVPQGDDDSEYRQIKLVAGERRLRALKHLGVKELIHGQHFLWLGEEDPLTLKSIELEENIRRKALSWQEELLGKRQLLDIMQTKYGPPVKGGIPRSQRVGLTPKGFGIRSLSRMLGETYSNVHRDLTIAEAIVVAPSLAKAETKEAAFRQMNIALTVHSMTKQAVAKAKQQAALSQQAATAAQPTALSGTSPSSTQAQAASSSSYSSLWVLHEGDFQANAHLVPSNSVDLIVTDLPYGAQLQGGPYHFAGVTGFDANAKIDTQTEALNQLTQVAKESYRVLKDNRFACFFFGFNYYGDLVAKLRYEGFDVVLVPIVWVKNTMSGELPHMRYRHSYEPILYACKGKPLFIRQARKDVMTFNAVLPKAKLMAPEKPVPLLQELITDMTAPGAVCLDWMAGSGSFGEAAVLLQRAVVLFEKDPVACGMIAARLGRL